MVARCHAPLFCTCFMRMYAPPLSVPAIGLSDQTWSALLLPALQGRLPRTYR